MGSFLAYGLAAVIDTSRGIDAGNPPSWLLAPNPFVFVAEATDLGEGGPLGGLHRAVDDAMGRGSQDTFGATVAIAPVPPPAPVTVVVGPADGAVVFQAGGGIQAAPILDEPRREGAYPMGLVSMLSLALLALVLLRAGSRRLRTPAEAER